MPIVSSTALRRDLSQRNGDRARAYGHELSFGPIPSVIYREEGGDHGNFIPESYRAICRNPEWRKRLAKHYSGGRWVPRAWERERRELDCANSSDALLMNIFCYPKVLRRPELSALLGIEPGLVPEFGFKPRIPLLNIPPLKHRGDWTEPGDQTEIDMRIGELLIEAKLTESALQSAPARLLSRYRDLHEIFDVEELRTRGDRTCGYQLIRGVLAAYASESSFLLLCDERRTDFIESWFEVVRAVRSYSFRNRLKLLTWQEVAGAVPRKLQRFLAEKYGIVKVNNSGKSEESSSL